MEGRELGEQRSQRIHRPQELGVLEDHGHAPTSAVARGGIGAAGEGENAGEANGEEGASHGLLTGRYSTRSVRPGMGRVAIHPLTPSRWSDLAQLFGPRGAV